MVTTVNEPKLGCVDIARTVWQWRRGGYVRYRENFATYATDRTWPIAMLAVTFQSKFAALAIGAVEGQQSTLSRHEARSAIRSRGCGFQ
jgi:hypothetical protein